ncbi:MAG: Crp/Fnr family transcriptional regulator [Pseudomonadota bacterium]
MSIEQDVATLRKIPLFAGIDKIKLKLLAFTSQRLTYAAGQELFHQGDDGDAAYVIIEGEGEVLVDTDDGPVRLAVVAKNSIVGEIAILCDVPRTATIRASTSLLTLRIEKKQFVELITKFPELAIEIMRVLGDRLTASNQELTRMRAALRDQA